MKFELVDIDNKTTAGRTFIGQTHVFEYYGNVFGFGPLFSSTVKSIEHTGENMIVKTQNSTYTFKGIR